MINFCNNGTLSLLDLTTMGDSSKRDDDSKTGMFDSGLKYAIAILMRNGTPPIIKSGGITYQFSTDIISDESGKKKEIIIVTKSEVGKGITDKIPTAFALNLGFQWSPWMAIREILSNCIDEGGEVFFSADLTPDNYDTVITIPENEVISEIIENWSSYFNSKGTIDVANGVKILPNVGKTLVIYKNGVRIYTDEEELSLYSYDIPTASIDEMRNANDISDLYNHIRGALKKTMYKTIIDTIIETSSSNLFEHRNINGNWDWSDTWVSIVNDLHENGSLPKLPEGMKSGMIENGKFKLGIKSIPRSEHWAATSVRVEVNEEIPVEEKLTFEEEVKKICKAKKVEVKFPIVCAKNPDIVLGDTKEKLLYISDDFSEEYVWKVLKEQYRIERIDENQIYKNYVELLNQ